MKKLKQYFEVSGKLSVKRILSTWTTKGHTQWNNTKNSVIKTNCSTTDINE